MKIKLVFCYLLVMLFLLAGMQTAQATLLTFDMNYEFSGATPPESSTTPWIRATFDDNNSPGSVRLTMEALNLTDAEHVKEWYFNYDRNATDLTIDFVSAIGVNQPFITRSSSQSEKADGDGKYNIVFEFSNAAAGRFSQGDSIVYDITEAGLLAGDFNFLSLPDGGSGPFYSAAHVGGIGANDALSGWIAPVDGTTPVPEPASMLLLGSGLLGLAGFGRKWLKA